jgi:GNAT superfamily N-acetyltransferase
MTLITTQQDQKQFEFRSLGPGDLDQVVLLVAASFGSEVVGQEVRSWLTRYFSEDRHNVSFEDQANLVVPMRYWVAVDGSGQIASLVGLYKLNWQWERLAWLGWFAVSKELKRSGLGTATIKAVMELAREYGIETLKVETGAKGEGRVFYEKLGFVQEGRLTNHFGPGVDGLIYSLNL